MSVRVFDLRGEPCELALHKWTPHLKRDPAKFAGVVLHQWQAKVGTMPASRARWGEPAALARRGLAAPYAINAGVTRVGEPVVGLCHPLTRYTYASDAGNRDYLAVSVMGAFPFEAKDWHPARHSEFTEALTAAVDEALALAVRLLGDAALEAGRLSPGPWDLITHRQCCNERGDHFACPGEQVVAAALASTAVRDGLLVPDPDRVLVAGVGKPWPAAWRQRL